MSKCVICGKDCASECCSGACRAKKSRRAQGKTERTQERTQERTPRLAPERTQGKCWCCGDDIQLGLVCCGSCAWSGKAKEKRAGRYPPLLTDRTPEQMKADIHSTKLTGGYQMTASERANYRPASELGPNEHNLVSKLGDEDYDGVCAPERING